MKRGISLIYVNMRPIAKSSIHECKTQPQKWWMSCLFTFLEEVDWIGLKARLRPSSIYTKVNYSNMILLFDAP